jgi:hypothetical protein
MSGLAAAAPPDAAPPLPPALPAAPLSHELTAMGAMHWQQLVQLLVAELARKDQAASAERAAMRAEAMHAVAQAARAQALAECAGRERYDLALSAERERFDLAVSAERAKAAEHKEAMWVARIMALQHKLDLSEGAGRARSLFKACTRDIAKRVGAAALLLSGPICPALCAYIDAVARANNLDPEEVMQQARCMYGARSDPLHSEQSVQQLLYTARFDRDKGEEAFAAFVAVVRFSGRYPSLYAQSGRRVALVLPAPPHSCTAAAEEVQVAGAVAAAAAAARARAPKTVRVSVAIMDEGRRREQVEEEEEEEDE